MSRYLPPLAFSTRNLPKRVERRFYRAIWKRFVLDNPDKGLRRLEIYNVPLGDTEYFSKEVPELWVKYEDEKLRCLIPAAKVEAVAKGYLTTDSKGEKYQITEKLYEKFASPIHIRLHKYMQSNPWWISLIALGVSVIALFRSY